MIEWLDTDGNGTVNRSEWILSLLEVLSFGFADEILQNTPKHSKVLEEQERDSINCHCQICCHCHLSKPMQGATLSQRVTARLYFLKKHSKIIKRVLIGILSKYYLDVHF